MSPIQHDIITAIFNCNYSCNDTCGFCFNAKDINKSPEMTLEEVKENYFYIKNKYGLDHVVISGGEPSLYSQFWKMMEFFYLDIHEEVRPALNTNSLNFVREDMYEQLFDLLKRSTRPRKQLSLSLSTVDDMKNPNPKEKLKIHGVQNTIKAALLSNTRVLLPVAITKSNYKALPDIADFLIHVSHNFENAPTLMSIQLRGLFLDKYMTAEQIKNTVPSFNETIPFIVSFIEKIFKAHLSLRIFNLPLCLLQDYMDLSSYTHTNNLKPLVELRMKIDHRLQFSKIRPGIFLDTAYKMPECEACTLRNACDKVQKEHIELGFMPALKPIYA